MSNFTVNNVIPVTRTDIESMFVKNNRTLIETIRSIIPSNNNTIEFNNNNDNNDNNYNDNNDNNVENNNDIIVDDNQFARFTWGGVINRMVPENFVFPSKDLHGWNRQSCFYQPKFHLMVNYFQCRTECQADRNKLATDDQTVGARV